MGFINTNYIKLNIWIWKNLTNYKAYKALTENP
jgi:hypothetical protein